MKENIPEKRTWYACDPVKNTGCKKLSCVYNPRAKFRACARTSDPACAMLDENGEPITWEAFDDYRMRLAVAYANNLAVQTPAEALSRTIRQTMDRGCHDA